MKNTKKIIFVVLLLFVLCMAIVFTATFLLYHHIRYNPIDTASISYLRQTLDTEEYIAEYGTIKSINRCIVPAKEQTEITVRAPYAVTTSKYRFDYMVTLVKKDGEWVGESFEIFKAYKIKNKKLLNGNTKQMQEPISIEQFR